MIVAFLQNPWFRPGTSQMVIDMYREDAGFRRRLLARSMTGRRLMHAFREMYSDIWWDNVSPQHGDDHREAMTPDQDHVYQVIVMNRPELVLTFGSYARGALSKIWHGPMMHCRHPNAMGIRQEEINQFAAEVTREIDRIRSTRDGKDNVPAQ